MAFDDVLKKLGYATGAVTGGPSQVKALSGLVKAQSDINSYLYSLGKKIGSFTGSNAFEAFANGASESADAETKAFVETSILPKLNLEKYTVPVLILILAGMYFLFKRFSK